MIRLQKILLEQGNFKDLGPDTYQVMQDPVFTGTASSSARELGGFKFSPDARTATKTFLNKPLTLTWSGNSKFNVNFGGKDLGEYDMPKFEQWLNKMQKDRGAYLDNKPTVDELKSLGFKASKDPKTGFDSYVKYVKTWWADTATEKKPKGYWSCNTAIRVFKQSGDKWMIRAQIVPDSFDDRILLALKDQDVRNANVSKIGTMKTKQSWLTGRDYKEFERITPEMQAKSWNKSISQAIGRIQRMPATTDTLIDTVSELESNIRSFKGLVGPYDDPKFRNNYLMQIVQKVKG